MVDGRRRWEQEMRGGEMVGGDGRRRDGRRRARCETWFQGSSSSASRASELPRRIFEKSFSRYCNYSRATFCCCIFLHFLIMILFLIIDIIFANLWSRSLSLHEGETVVDLFDHRPRWLEIPDSLIFSSSSLSLSS